MNVVMGTPSLEATSTEEIKLHTVLSKILERKTGPVPEAERDTATHWPASHFFLDQVSCFQTANKDQKEQILLECSQMLVRESYFIEKGGMYYTSKISMLSELTEERMLYSFFAADEATHFHWISQFCSAVSVGNFESNPFLVLLSDIAEHENRITMIYLLQVVLEGWGLHHYRELVDECVTPELKEVFKNILKDESSHHGGGLVILNAQKMSTEDQKRICEILGKFLGMVQSGSQGVVSILQKILGPFSHQELVQIFQELHSEAESNRKLALISNCIRSATSSESILNYLNERNALTAFDTEICAQIAVSA